MEKISGIYKIINKVNNKYYIGSSKNIDFRWKIHIRQLNNQKHHNEYLQRAWNKYGSDVFDFVIVENVSVENLLTVEQKYLNEISKSDNCYNLIFHSQGGTQSDYIIEKMKKNHWSKKGFFPWNIGKTHSEKSKNLMRLKALGRIPSNKDIRSYSFIDTKTNEIFTGTKEEFAKKVNVSIPLVNAFVRGKYHSSKGWRLYPLDDYIKQSYVWSANAKDRVNLLRKKDPITKQFLPN